MKNKGFTLVELLAVIAIMALIAGITVPNIISMVDKGKKEDYIKEARSVVAKAKYKYGRNKYKNNTDIFNRCDKTEFIEENNTTNNTECYCITVGAAGISNTIDAYGYTYDVNNSRVRICEEGEASYEIDLRSGAEGKGKCLSKTETDKCPEESYINVKDLKYENVIDR